VSTVVFIFIYFSRRARYVTYLWNQTGLQKMDIVFVSLHNKEFIKVNVIIII